MPRRFTRLPSTMTVSPVPPRLRGSHFLTDNSDAEESSSPCGYVPPNGRTPMWIDGAEYSNPPGDHSPSYYYDSAPTSLASSSTHYHPYPHTHAVSSPGPSSRRTRPHSAQYHSVPGLPSNEESSESTPALFPQSISNSSKQLPSSPPTHLPVMADVLIHHFDLTSSPLPLSTASSYHHSYFDYGPTTMSPVSNTVEARSH